MNRKIITKQLMEKIYNDYINLDPLTWQSFADAMNEKYNLLFSESAYRKRITLYIQMVDLIAITENKDIREKYLNVKEIKLESQKKHINSLNKEFKELKKDYLRNDEMVELISTFVSPSISFQKIETQENDLSNVFIISDIQEWGNNCSKNILEYVYNKIADVIKKEKLKEIYLFDLGDFIDNVLHTSQFFSNEGTVMLQIKYYQEAMAKLLEELSKKVKINFCLLASNHGQYRPLGLKASELPEEDFAVVVLSYLKAYLRNNQNINWLNGDSLEYCVVNVQGYNLWLAHGNQKVIKPNNFNISFHKVNQYYSNFDYDYIFIGHYHHLKIEHIISNQKKGNDKLMVIVPACDLRISKNNERTLGLSSNPAFTRFKFEKEKGLVGFDKYDFPKEMWVE